MATDEELAQALRDITEANERIEAKLDRLLGVRGVRSKRRLVVAVPPGPLPGTKKSRREAALLLGLRVTNR